MFYCNNLKYASVLEFESKKILQFISMYLIQLLSRVDDEKYGPQNIQLLDFVVCITLAPVSNFILYKNQ